MNLKSRGQVDAMCVSAEFTNDWLQGNVVYANRRIGLWLVVVNTTVAMISSMKLIIVMRNDKNRIVVETLLVVVVVAVSKSVINDQCG